MGVVAVRLPHRRLPLPLPLRTARLVRLWRLQRVERVLLQVERRNQNLLPQKTQAV